MRVFNFVFVAVFILFAALQYNDPDPYIWMPVYLFAAFLCWQASQWRFNGNHYVFGFIIYAGYALYLLVDKTGVLDWVGEHHAESIVQSMHATKPWIEETREFGGLLIVLVVMTINVFAIRRHRKLA